MKKLYLILSLTVAVVLTVAAVIAWRAWTTSPEADRVKLTPARVSEIKSMVELQTVEIYEELPLKGSIGKRHLVGRMAMEGTVGFNLEKLQVAERGDTIVVTLPPAKVTLRESTQPGAYQVIDTWSDDLMGSAQFSTAEENVMKRKLLEGAERGIYNKGYVASARANAERSVKRLLEASTGRPVVVMSYE